MTDIILAHRDRPLPVGSIGYMSTGWAAAIFLLISEASIFVYLFFAYLIFQCNPTIIGRREVRRLSPIRRRKLRLF